MAQRASIEGQLEAEPGNAHTLAQIAESVDEFVDRKPGERRYDLAGSVVAILNGGTHEQIMTALKLLRRWSFKPKDEK